MAQVPSVEEIARALVTHTARRTTALLLEYPLAPDRGDQSPRARWWLGAHNGQHGLVKTISGSFAGAPSQFYSAQFMEVGAQHLVTEAGAFSADWTQVLPRLAAAASRAQLIDGVPRDEYLATVARLPFAEEPGKGIPTYARSGENSSGP